MSDGDCSGRSRICRSSPAAVVPPAWNCSWSPPVLDPPPTQPTPRSLSRRTFYVPVHPGRSVAAAVLPRLVQLAPIRFFERTFVPARSRASFSSTTLLDTRFSEQAVDRSTVKRNPSSRATRSGGGCLPRMIAYQDDTHTRAHTHRYVQRVDRSSDDEAAVG